MKRKTKEEEHREREREELEEKARRMREYDAHKAENWKEAQETLREQNGEISDVCEYNRQVRAYNAALDAQQEQDDFDM